ncbi:hypothetical protein [Clostridium hydrogenum]|nr:hypothetical protein [Clostridium hydrogenum]
MSFFKGEKLYRVEVIKEYPIMNIMQCASSNGFVYAGNAGKCTDFI